jgi:hypothetical protein
LRAWWRHRPRGAILAFFDVQPITVKAYGGRRYTRGKRLVLARNQKTRGRFYRFLLYELNRGLVHWSFDPGKGAVYVCRFLRRVRRWYPRQPVRIALDRDPAHPIKAHVTRSLMRRLGLNWTPRAEGPCCQAPHADAASCRSASSQSSQSVPTGLPRASQRW